MIPGLPKLVREELV